MSFPRKRESMFRLAQRLTSNRDSRFRGNDAVPRQGGKSKGPEKQKGRPEAAFSTNAAGRRSMIVVMTFMIMVMIVLVVMMLMRLVIIVFVALDQTGKLVAIHAL